jgi:antitoxin (DNA-binding transcriptional repressor) of toxin-antitoxin stability system
LSITDGEVVGNKKNLGHPSQSKTSCRKSIAAGPELCIFGGVKTKLAQLRRDTAKVVRPAIRGGEKLTLPGRGQPCAKIIPLPKIDRRAACQDLMAIGPVKFLPRK